MTTRIQKLEHALKTKGITVFAVIDHSAQAQVCRIAYAQHQLLIFGDPRAGTPIMLRSSSVAIDLPLKILVFGESGGDVWLCYKQHQ